MDAKQFLAEFGHIVNAPEGVQQLRKLILKLAVTGQLGTNDSRDEPASALLGRIDLEYKRLLDLKIFKEQKKVLKTRNIDTMTIIPNSWVWCDIQRVFYPISVPNNKKLLSKNIQSSGQFKVVDQGQSYYSGYSDDKKRVIEIPQKVIVFGDHTKAIKLIDFNFIPGADGIKILKPLLIVEEYFYLVMKSYDLSDRGYGRHYKILMDQYFPLATLEEQKRIVAKVDELMALCDKLEAQQQKRRKLQTLTRTTALDALANAKSPHELKDAWQRVQSNLPFLIDETGSIKDLKNLVLFLAIRGLLSKQNSESDDKEKIRKALKMKRAGLSENKVVKNQKKSAPISEEELPFKLPLGWYWSRFQDVSICRDGQRIPLSKENRSIRQGKYDYYGASGVIDKIDDYIFDGTLLLIGEDGANLINRSTPIAFLAVGKYWVNNHAHVIDSYSTLGLKYLELFINAIDLKPYITGTAQPKMNQAKMNSIVVAMPPLEEQQRIVEIVENLLSTCDRLENQLNKANQTAKNLSKTAIASIAGIEIKEVEKVKIPKTELVSTLRLKVSPTNKDLAPLSAILAKHNGELSSKALWNYSGLEIDAFYQQLKTEMARDWIVEPEKARMIEKDADNQSEAEAG